LYVYIIKTGQKVRFSPELKVVCPRPRVESIACRKRVCF
jgi:hypothetical protein